MSMGKTEPRLIKRDRKLFGFYRSRVALAPELLRHRLYRNESDGLSTSSRLGNKPTLLRFTVLMLCCLGVSLSAAPLDLEALDDDWQALFESMQSVGRVAAPFEESRSFTFRKEPKRYRGVFRRAADGRVSLAYTEPKEMVLHIGEGFAYYRKGAGSVRRIPGSNTQASALALLPDLLNFELETVAQYYEISGQPGTTDWHLVFKAKTGAEDELPYRRMELTGSGTVVQRIELSKSESQQIIIELGDPVYPDFYLPQAKADYFFYPARDAGQR